MTQSDLDINTDRDVPEEVKEDADVKSERLNTFHENQNIERLSQSNIEARQRIEREEEEMLDRLRNINREFEKS